MCACLCVGMRVGVSQFTVHTLNDRGVVRAILEAIFCGTKPVYIEAFRSRLDYSTLKRNILATQMSTLTQLHSSIIRILITYNVNYSSNNKNSICLISMISSGCWITGAISSYSSTG